VYIDISAAYVKGETSGLKL